jgi:hypothetical protein
MLERLPGRVAVNPIVDAFVGGKIEPAERIDRAERRELRAEIGPANEDGLDAIAHAAMDFLEIGQSDLGLPVTFLLTSFYWDNMIHFGMGPRKGPDGKLAITLPMGDKKLPGIAAEDIGKCAYAIFKNGDGYIGNTLGIAGEHLTGTQMAAALTKALGEEVRYQDVPPEVYRGFGFPGADDMGNMFQFKADFNDLYCGNRPLALSNYARTATVVLFLSTRSMETDSTMPGIGELNQRFRNRGVLFVGIFSNPAESGEEMRTFAQRRGFMFPFYRDPWARRRSSSAPGSRRGWA